MAETIKKPSGELGLGNATDNKPNSILNQVPQVVFMDIHHASDCPAIYTQSKNDCTCKAIKATVLSTDAWLKRFGQRRKQRRAGERAAAKAQRKAKS